MTVEMGGVGLFDEWEAKLGPDPLREDADAEVRRVHAGLDQHRLMLLLSSEWRCCLKSTT
jgi:hypothetical protein